MARTLVALLEESGLEGIEMPIRSVFGRVVFGGDACVLRRNASVGGTTHLRPLTVRYVESLEPSHQRNEELDVDL
jgi:hypothetical protein